MFECVCACGLISSVSINSVNYFLIRIVCNCYCVAFKCFSVFQRSRTQLVDYCKLFFLCAEVCDFVIFK